MSCARLHPPFPKDIWLSADIWRSAAPVVVGKIIDRFGDLAARRRRLEAGPTLDLASCPRPGTMRPL
jgi:hypothetical protein